MAGRILSVSFLLTPRSSNPPGADAAADIESLAQMIELSFQRRPEVEQAASGYVILRVSPGTVIDSASLQAFMMSFEEEAWRRGFWSVAQAMSSDAAPMTRTPQLDA